MFIDVIDLGLMRVSCVVQLGETKKLVDGARPADRLFFYCEWSVLRLRRINMLIPFSLRFRSYCSKVGRRR
jgi:hypothetical protein